MKQPSVMIIAGEPSADRHGADVLRRLWNQLPELTSFGIGGPEMEEQGFEPIMSSFNGLLRMKHVSCIVPTGHLSYAPMEPGSFYTGLQANPGAIIADAGSCDIGPSPLGTRSAASPEEWQRFDIDHMLRGARQLHIPMIISSCAGGEIDMSHVVYTQVDDKTTEVRGMKFRPASEYWVKIEGAGKVGERCYVIVGVRDPQTIANIDIAIGWATQKVEAWYGAIGGTYQLYYHVYGKNAVLGALEPVREIRSHELGIVVEVIADSLSLAERIVTLAARGIFYTRLPTKGTAGGGAFLTEDVLIGKPAYEWTLNHVIRIDDPLQCFPMTLETVDV